eukprot:CAMPEP_0181036354 /NCGR_PEP_ID=MMETSP1070-20121207/8808_1 /TAXON_ID=265543 /ORGANISM="Minutocellus polymorphus, Strain NH13" /LENGTH=344 /DNA_ID=CAMNT_0023113967 /DNA_START=117 /DNA_END=1151 /DNA_ORIENTATION=+
MPPPAKKKRKTAAGSVPVGTRRSTRSQKPALSIEVIGKVASFVNYDDGDLLNICLAVGRKESAVVRYTCLRNNMRYLEHCLKQFVGYNLKGSRMKANTSCWMEVNTDWRKLCTKERTEDDGLSTPRYQNEEGELISRTDPLILFNNPAVAIEFEVVDVLKHLVEEIGVDINAYKWVGYRFRERCHLLYLSYCLCSQNDVSKSFEYIVSREDVDVCATQTRGEGSNMVWQSSLLTDRISFASFEAFVRHRSFDPNRDSEIGGFVSLPLHHAITGIIVWAAYSRATSIAMDKVEFLLKVGADPKLATQGYPSPLDYTRSVLRGEGEQSRKGKLCKALVSMLEQYTD